MTKIIAEYTECIPATLTHAGTGEALTMDEICALQTAIRWAVTQKVHDDICASTEQGKLYYRSSKHSTYFVADRPTGALRLHPTDKNGVPTEAGSFPAIEVYLVNHISLMHVTLLP